MTHIRRNTLFVTVLAVTCLAALFSPGSEALDRPGVVDTKQSGCAFTVTQDLVQQLSTSGRTFEALAGVVPRDATLEFKLNSKGKPTDTILLAGTYRWDFDKTRVNDRDCSVRAEIPRAEFGTSGLSGRLELSWHTRPQERAYLRAYNLKSNGGPVRGEHLWFFKPMGAQVAEQPRPEELPLTPVPRSEPAPLLGFPLYLGGPLLLNGARGNGKVWKVPHPNCDDHTVTKDGVTSRVCVAGEGDTSLTAFNVTPKNFQLKKTEVLRIGWEWSPFLCQPAPNGTVGCTAKGKYLGYDILGTISNLQVSPGTRNFGADLSVRLLATQADVLFRADGQVDSLGF